MAVQRLKPDNPRASAWPQCTAICGSWRPAVMLRRWRFPMAPIRSTGGWIPMSI